MTTVCFCCKTNTGTSNLNAIQPTVHKMWRPQAFWVAIFSKCSSSAILFLMNSSQKLIRSSEIPREPLYKILMQSLQQLIKYGAHKLLGGHLGKWPLMAW